MPKKVFISGPVSGRVYEEAKAEFDSVAYEIKKKHGDAVEVVNPFDFCRKGEPWEQAMRKCIARLTKCDYIHCLPYFYKSEGARLEMTIAEKLKMGVCNEILELVDYQKNGGEILKPENTASNKQVRKCIHCGRIGEGYWGPVNIITIGNVENIEYAFECPFCHEITYSLKYNRFVKKNNESL